jgi:phosphonoacetate hydrolase
VDRDDAGGADADATVVERLRGVDGIELALSGDAACREFELPVDRTGDVVVCV